MDNDEALQLLREALDLFSNTHELCYEVGSSEWVWRFRVLHYLDDAQSDLPFTVEVGELEY